MRMGLDVKVASAESSPVEAPVIPYDHALSTSAKPKAGLLLSLMTTPQYPPLRNRRLSPQQLLPWPFPLKSQSPLMVNLRTQRVAVW